LTRKQTRFIMVPRMKQTTGKLFIEERLEKIMELVREKGKVTVEDAMELCAVSADTIRRDFNRLSWQDIVKRTHGGIMIKDSSIYDSSTAERIVKNIEVKRLIAERAADFINEGDTIAVDAGTTTVQLIPHLQRFEHLTLVVYSLDVAEAAVKNERITTMMAGGIIRNKTESVVGPDAVTMIKNLHADTLFLGTNAIEISKGLMTPNRMEAEMKETLLSIADRVILLADSSKIGKRALFPFGKLDDIDLFITDKQAERIQGEFLRRLEQLHKEVILV
jgi:DeoR family transcriptional regulator, fructose operon transcriptional repressor